MATTDQRVGFRLPWASEPKRDPSDDAVETAISESATTEDAVTQEAATATIDPRSAAWPAADATGPTVVAAPPESAPVEVVAAVEVAAPAATAAPADVAASAERATAASTAPSPTATPDAAEPTPATRPRRDNPLVTGLVRAMRDAAVVARQETTARFADETKSRIEELHAKAAVEATAIRHAADEDISAVRDWSKAEMARIRDETERRITGRRRRLELETDEHAARVEHRIEAARGSIAVFNAEMDAFFEQLLAEEDPARLAGLAEQLPEPPTLEDLDDGWVASQALDARGAAAAEAEALAEFALGADGLPVEGRRDAQPELAVVGRLAEFTDPAARPEAEAATTLSVIGLVSVAAIAGFKRSIARLPGVRGVAVASGPNGDFIFTVQHAGTTDLRTAIPDLDGFAARITGDADGVLSVTATDPDVAR